MLASILETMRQDCQLNPGQTLLVGVSGGPDSLCLLHALQRSGYAVIAAYYNHHLRPEAADEARFVENMATQMGIHYVGGEGEVAEEARRSGQSIEATAREMRYRFLFDSAREFGADAVVVAHNANDQVETVLMHLLRGSGLDGLRGMQFRSLTTWDEHIPLVRPLLRCWRNEIEAYCEEAGLHPLLDASNLEPTYLRNRVRLTLLPELEQLTPGAAQRIWGFTRLAAEELQFVDELEQRAWMNCVMETGDEFVSFDLTRLRGEDVTLQRRLLRRAAQTLRPAGEGIDRETVWRAVDFLRSPGRRRQLELAQKMVLRIDQGTLLMAASEYRGHLERYPCLKDDTLLADIPAAYLKLGDGWSISIEQCGNPTPDEFKLERSGLQLETWLDADAVTGKLSLRRPRPGDRYQPLGLAGGSQKLSDFWINHHVPAEVRGTWPLVLCGSEIAWVPGFAPAHRFRLRPESRHCLHLKIERK